MYKKLVRIAVHTAKKNCAFLVFIIYLIQMKKLMMIVLVSMITLPVLWCAKKNGDIPNVNTEKTVVQQENKNQNNDSAGNTTKAECMNGCEMMRNSNTVNKWKSAGDMQIDCDNICEASQGIQNNDVSSCEKSEWMLKYGCYTEIATETKDVSICKKIDDKTFMNACFSSIAEDTKDAKICNNIEDTMFRNICTEGAQNKE